MQKKFIAAAMAATMLATAGIGGAFAQGYRDRDRGASNNNDPMAQAYSQGYREGYEDARLRRPFDDSYNAPPSAGPRGPGYGNGPGPGPAYGDNDRDGRWRQRYQQQYTYQDDSYYRECRNQPDPGGVIAGALIGGLLGNVIGKGSGQAAATVAGVVIGGVAGASLTSKMDCGDRSYAYKTYYNGFNAGRPNASYDWRNPQNGHRGVFQVGSYYNDPDNFRCATYSQVVYINNRPEETRGRACQQPDGTWAIVS